MSGNGYSCAATQRGGAGRPSWSNTMSPHEKALVRETWGQVAPIADTAARLFYDRLFELDPDLRSLFAGVDMPSQRTKLVQALATVVAGIDRLDDLLPTIQDLGHRHAGYGVTDAHYATVAAALLWTLERGLGAAWNDAAAGAWTKAYTLIAGVMRSAAVAAPTGAAA
jgi:hemoglobin-like flavoprotein